MIKKQQNQSPTTTIHSSRLVTQTWWPSLEGKNKHCSLLLRTGMKRLCQFPVNWRICPRIILLDNNLKPQQHQQQQQQQTTTTKRNTSNKQRRRQQQHQQQQRQQQRQRQKQRQQQQQ